MYVCTAQYVRQIFFCCCCYEMHNFQVFCFLLTCSVKESIPLFSIVFYSLLCKCHISVCRTGKILYLKSILWPCFQSWLILFSSKTQACLHWKCQDLHLNTLISGSVRIFTKTNQRVPVKHKYTFLNVFFLPHSVRNTCVYFWTSVVMCPETSEGLFWTCWSRVPPLYLWDIDPSSQTSSCLLPLWPSVCLKPSVRDRK